jgi:hypothetical protein
MIATKAKGKKCMTYSKIEKIKKMIQKKFAKVEKKLPKRCSKLSKRKKVFIILSKSWFKVNKKLIKMSEIDFFLSNK